MLRVERIFGFHNREFVYDSTKIAIIPVNAQALFGAIPTREQQRVRIWNFTTENIAEHTMILRAL